MVNFLLGSYKKGGANKCIFQFFLLMLRISLEILIFCHSAQKCLILPAECSPQKSLILPAEFIQAYQENAAVSPERGGGELSYDVFN